MPAQESRIVAAKLAGGQSRLAGIQVSLLTLRLVEHLREQVGDHTSALILLAVIAITSEKLTRSNLEPGFRSVTKPIPIDRLAICNVSSIACAIGLNRETTRRYVLRLVTRGVLERTPAGSIAFAKGYIQREETSGVLQAELEVLSRSVTELLRLGALRLTRQP